jgi:hypothetical protein
MRARRLAMTMRAKRAMASVIRVIIKKIAFTSMPNSFRTCANPVGTSRAGEHASEGMTTEVVRQRQRGLVLGFGSFWTARRTLAGYETMARIRKGQVRNIDGRDIAALARFIANLFDVAA